MERRRKIHLYVPTSSLAQLFGDTVTYLARDRRQTSGSDNLTEYVTVIPKVGTELDAVAECSQARPVGTTPIVAWHEVPGKASLERAVP
jgi:hypothetical protein